MPSDHSGLGQDNNRKTSETSPNVWKPNHTLLNNSWIEEKKIKEGT